MDKGIIIDLETSGLDYKKDSIIEIGIIEFVICDTDNSLHITNMYSSLQDPGFDISSSISEVTHIRNDFLKSESINWDVVSSFFKSASIVIAHNAEFDSKFLAKRPEIKDIPVHWGCSLNHINWHAHGFKTRALNYLAADMQFVNPFAHRALFDCATTFRVIQNYILELINTSYEQKNRITVSKSAYELSQSFKDRGYKWNKDEKSWFKEVFESTLNDEKTFLQTITEKQELPMLISIMPIESLDEAYRRVQIES